MDMRHRIGIDLEYEVGLMDTFNFYLQKSRERIENHKITNTNEAISAYFHERKGVVLNTLHGIKGEEYTTVSAYKRREAKTYSGDGIYSEKLNAVVFDMKEMLPKILEESSVV